LSYEKKVCVFSNQCGTIISSLLLPKPTPPKVVVCFPVFSQRRFMVLTVIRSP
jgi:hypothetical protein